MNYVRNLTPKLVEAYIVADIFLYKLKIRKLFTDLGQPEAYETNCGKQVDKLAADNVRLLKQHLISKHVFLIVDEGKVISYKHVIFLIADISGAEKTYLLHCSVVEKMNQHVVASKIDELKKLDIERKNFVLLLSDTARHMTSCTAMLKICPQLFHITCLVHLLHHCSKKVCSHFSDVLNLIATVKAMTVKNKH